MSNDKQRYVVKAASEMRPGREYVDAAMSEEIARKRARELNAGTSAVRDEPFVWRPSAGWQYAIVDSPVIATVLGQNVRTSDLTDSSAFLDPKPRGDSPGFKAAVYASIGAADPVAQPDHYRAGVFECRDVIEALGLNFNRGSAFKYLWRAGRKQGVSELEDLRKAREQIDAEIRRIERAK